MYDKLKQAFVGKPWTQQQITDWERTRGKGKALYAARVALWWGTIMVVATSITGHFLGSQPLSIESLLVRALINYPIGFLLGFYFWSVNENKYRESLNAK
ncbi:MAG TPA: hypothetical protein VJ810_04475 [Blastocatellia bacterium]|nr:hypothetical protein [Blastocatellia bacterium]